MTAIQRYAIVSPALPHVKKTLLQTHVRPAAARQLDALAKASGRTRAGYLRLLVEEHLRSQEKDVAPELAGLAKRLPS